MKCDYCGQNGDGKTCPKCGASRYSNNGIPETVFERKAREKIEGARRHKEYLCKHWFDGCFVDYLDQFSEIEYGDKELAAGYNHLYEAWFVFRGLRRKAYTRTVGTDTYWFIDGIKVSQWVYDGSGTILVDIERQFA